MIRMTSNTTPAPFVASASSEFTGAVQFAWHAFDEDYNFSWMPQPGSFPPAWLMIDWGDNNKRVLKRYTLQLPNLSVTHKRAPKDWTIEGSHDGLTWYVLHTAANQTDWLVTPRRTYIYDDTPAAKIAYRYTRMYITANNGAGPDGDLFVTVINQWSPDGAGQASRCY